jgi:hypothetical protein
MAWYPWPMPSADAVGSKEQLSLARARRHAFTIALMVVLRRMKEPVPAITTRLLLSGSIIVNMVRSAESAVSRRVLLKVIRLSARLRVQPNAVAMADMERNSSGMRTELGISRLRSVVERMTRMLVRKAMKAW